MGYNGSGSLEIAHFFCKFKLHGTCKPLPRMQYIGCITAPLKTQEERKKQGERYSAATFRDLRPSQHDVVLEWRASTAEMHGGGCIGDDGDMGMELEETGG